MNDLNNFSTIRRTDKFDLGYVDLFYNDLFAKKQLSTTSVLEIGVDQGQSILLWRDYFQNAQIYALDINPKPQSLVIDSDRITYYQIDAYRHESVADLRQFGKGEFDIIIDDGPHTLESMIFFLKNYVDLLAPGGILVLEDIIDVKWTPYLLSLIDSKIGKISRLDTRGKQKTPYLLDLWKNGLEVIIIEKF
jgi:2-polyprenyl-3-methyl-5-hydroxy-6-metoxy-1,4-benzoquinol methylase